MATVKIAQVAMAIIEDYSMTSIRPFSLGVHLALLLAFAGTVVPRAYAAAPTFDLVISVESVPNPVPVDSAIEYVIKVRNQGDEPSSGFNITGLLPASTAFVSIDADLGSSYVEEHSGAFLARYEALAPGGEVEVILVALVAAPAGSSLGMTVQAISDRTDSAPGNNRATIVTPVIDCGADGLRVTVTDSPDPAVFGTLIVETIVIENVSGQTVSNIMLESRTPEHTTLVGIEAPFGDFQAPPAGEKGTISGSLEGLEAGASITIRITLHLEVTDDSTIVFALLVTDVTGATCGVTQPTFVIAPGEGYLIWEEPDDPSGDLPPPVNARISGSTASARAPVSARRDAPKPISYNIYRSATPNVRPTPANLFTSVPSGQLNTGSVQTPDGAFVVVTAVYPAGESTPSNEVSAGAGEPVIESIDVGRHKLVAHGTGLVSGLLVTVDGVPFVEPSHAKQNGTRLVQRGKLLSGLTVDASVPAGQPVLVCFRTPSGATTCIPVSRP